MKRVVNGLLAILSIVVIACVWLVPMASAQQPESNALAQVERNNLMGILIGAILAIGIAGLSSAFGLMISGSAAAAVAGEKPELGMRLVVIEVMPMTQTLYGLVVVLFLLLGAGLLGGKATVDLTNPAIGVAGITAGLILGITGISAIAQGITAASSISAFGRDQRVFAPGLIYVVMVETIALFGLVAAIFVLFGFNFI
jgi:V/A-type H+-transporting ATPase subunit K